MNRSFKSWALIVTGVACVGKTSFGSRLAEHLKLEFIDIPRFIEEMKLYEYFDEDSKEYVVDLRRLSNCLGSFIRGKQSVIASIYPIKPRNISIKLVLVLRLRPDELMKRLLERGYPEWKIAENISAEIIDKPLHEAIVKYGRRKVVQLDVTGKDLERLSRDVSLAISSMNIRDLHTDVDWISELEKTDYLTEILQFLAKIK
ncbi:MAG: AAA family ATPase [Aigarchaeota archaeon]|nr:AAA family ATPase [Aigarchaeota archaeon]MCX8192475.1 AAA family ATPase [Nitrososphaeria archaeon]MDW7985789.1 AAA family ATPase [Nitrososphaerota archaeon]